MKRSLNDWVSPVRVAARKCAERVFPKTSAFVIAETAFSLLRYKHSWKRWGDEKAILDHAVTRPDVAEQLVEIIATRTSGPIAMILRQALRQDAFDRYLEILAIKARHPAVRSTALQTLLNGKACWPDGFEWKWTDKSMGIKHRVAHFEYRQIDQIYDIEMLIKRGLQDKSSAVRRVALDGLILHMASIKDAHTIAQPFSTDRILSIRERADFILRKKGASSLTG